MNKIIYLDIDDTLADTSLTLKNSFNIPHFSFGKASLFDFIYLFRYFKTAKNIYQDHSFWHSLPLKNEANDIFKLSSTITPNIKVLTALPRYYLKNKKHFLLAKKAKVDWINTHFPQIYSNNVIVSYAKDKHEQIINDGNLHILIDDNFSNIKKWKNNGGLAIHCTTAEHTLSQLSFIKEFKFDNHSLLHNFNKLFNSHF